MLSCRNDNAPSVLICGWKGFVQFLQKGPYHHTYINFRFISSKERELNGEVYGWTGPFMRIKDMGVILGRVKGDKWICCS